MAPVGRSGIGWNSATRPHWTARETGYCGPNTSEEREMGMVNTVISGHAQPWSEHVKEPPRENRVFMAAGRSQAPLLLHGYSPRSKSDLPPWP